MSTRSRKIRAERRMKDAQKWAGMKKPVGGRLPNGLVKSSETGVGCKTDGAVMRRHPRLQSGA